MPRIKPIDSGIRFILTARDRMTPQFRKTMDRAKSQFKQIQLSTEKISATTERLSSSYGQYADKLLATVYSMGVVNRRIISGMTTTVKVGASIEHVTLQTAGLIASQELLKEGISDKVAKDNYITGVKKQYEELSKIINELGGKTVATHKQVSETVLSIARAGFKNTQIIRNIAKASIDYGIASRIPTDEAITTIVDSVRAFDPKLADSGDVFGIHKLTRRIINAYAAATASTSINPKSLVESLKHSLPIGKKFKLDPETLSAMIGIAGNFGVKAEMAGTAIKVTMMRIFNESRKKIQALGISLIDPNNPRKAKHVIDILGEIGEKLSQLPEPDQLGKLNDIFGTRAILGSTPIMENIPTLRKLIKNIKSMGRADFADTYANLLKMTTHSQIELSRSAIQSVQYAVFESNKKAIGKVLSKFIVMTLKISEFIKNHPAFAQIGFSTGGIAAAMIAAATAVGYLILIINGSIKGLIIGFGALKAGLLSLKMALLALGGPLTLGTLGSALGLASIASIGMWQIGKKEAQKYRAQLNEKEKNWRDSITHSADIFGIQKLDGKWHQIRPYDSPQPVDVNVKIENETEYETIVQVTQGGTASTVLKAVGTTKVEGTKKTE